MSNFITRVLAVVPFDSAGSASKAPRVQPTPSTSDVESDTAQLSEARVVHQLHNQEETVAQIASRLSLSVTAVSSYLANAA